MSFVNLSHYKELKQIEAQFDKAYVSLLRKVNSVCFVERYVDSAACPEQTSQQKDRSGEESDESEDSSSEAPTHSSDEDEDKGIGNEQIIEPYFHSELITLPLCFGKLMVKSLLALERVDKQADRIAHLERENCTLKATLDNYQELSAMSEENLVKTSHDVNKVQRKNFIAFKNVIDQEVEKRLKNNNKQCEQREDILRNEIITLRLTVDYLKTELSGRLQQLQLMDKHYTHQNVTSNDEELFERIWCQIAEEMVASRYKTAVQVITNHDKHDALKPRSLKSSGDEESQEEMNFFESILEGCKLTNASTDAVVNSLKFGQFKFISIYIQPDEQVGLGVMGGSLCNMPLIVWKIFPGTVADKSKKFKVGDMIMSLENVDVTDYKLPNFVAYFKNYHGWCRFGVLRIPVNPIAHVE